MDRGTFSSKVTSRATSLAEAAFSDPAVARVSIDLVPRFEHSDPKLWRLARQFGLVASENGHGLSFTAKGLRVSVDCATYGEPYCRRFPVAHSRFIRAVGFAPGWDGIGEIRDLFVETEVVSEPEGSFASAMAFEGVLSCLNGARMIPWHGARTHATVTIAFGFTTDLPIDHDDAIIAALNAESPSRQIDCPFSRDRLEDNENLTDNVH